MLNRVGNTPLVKLESLSSAGREYFAKLEGHNPFGSVKDRAAYWMIKDGEERGILKRGHSIIIEPTSGNTGIALTGIANLLGYKTEIVIPEKASDETKAIIRQLGAKVYETSDDLCPKVGAGTDQSIALATLHRIVPPRHLLLAKPVRQRGQLYGALQGHRPGDLEADRR